MDEHKLKVKFGEFEFEASGTEASVQKQFELFMKGVTAPPVPKQPLPPKDGAGGTGTNTDGAKSDRPRQTSVGAAIEQQTIDSAFACDAKGTVSLKAIPSDSENSNADALLLILYGFRVVKSQNDVMVTQLAIAARQSGVNVERVDRTIAARQGLFLKAGLRRGGKYQLNNRGIQHAEALLRDMFQ